MTDINLPTIIVGAVPSGAAALAAYLFLIQPQLLRWGVTETAARANED
jgi:hypothetical protein